MKKLLSLAAILALASQPALADYSYTQGSGTNIKAGTLSGGVLPWFNPVDANGAPVTGTLAAGAAPTSGFPFLCEYLSAGITLTNGQTAAIQCTAGGSLHTTVDNSSLAVTGTFWQATQPVSGTVTANAGTNLNTSLLALESGGNLASIKTDVDNLNLAQGSTTSGQKGNLNLGAVTTGAPTYTTGQSSPLSLDTAGNLRVNVMAGGGSGGTSSSFGSAFPSTGTAAGLEYLSSPPTLTTGNMGAFQGDVNGNLKVNIQGCASAVCAPLGQTTMSGSAPVTIASDQSNLPANLKQVNGSTLSLGQTTKSASLPVTIASDQGALGTTPTPAAGVGLTPAIKAGLTNSAVSVKASAGSLGAVNCDNANTGSVIVEFFNTASVTLGTTAPSWVVSIPAGGGGSNIPMNIALGGSAIYVAAVTAYNGSTAPSTALNCAIGYI